MASNLDAAPALTAGMSKLNVKVAAKVKPSKNSETKSKDTSGSKAVAESWDDDSVSSDSDDGAVSSMQHDSHRAGTAAPPPTPVAPSHNPGRGFGPPPDVDGAGDSGVRRPEKTDAVARRMISAGLGLKAPKLTDEQKAYDKAVKEKERKRREQEKEAERRKEAETAKARAAIWED
jgi:hypothetical protein